MNDKINKTHLLTRFILLFNIIFIMITLIFFILFNNEVLHLSIPEYFEETLKKINISVFIFGFLIIFFNIYLLINHLFFNTKQYFKLAEKIDFNDLPTSLGILNNLPSIDEFGYLGQRVTKLLRVYLNYANLIRKRINYKDKALKILLDEAKISLLTFEKQVDKTYILTFVSSSAIKMLDLENSSSIIGKNTAHLLSRETHAKIQHIVSNNPREAAPTQINLHDTVELIKQTVDKDGIKEESFISIDAMIIPMSFQFSDDYYYQDSTSNNSNFNNITDSFFIILKNIIGNEDEDNNLEYYDEIPDPTFEDLNIDEHLQS